MPADPADYRTRGGNIAIVLCCPTIVSPARLVYFDHNPAGSWVIGDFLAGFKLSDETSPLTVAQVEQDAIYSEPPPWCNVETAPADWRFVFGVAHDGLYRTAQQECRCAAPKPSWSMAVAAVGHRGHVGLLSERP